MKISIGADHAGFEYKEKIKEHLENNKIEVDDAGTHSPDSVDYPDFAHPVASRVERGQSDLGILVCGSANGVAITANKHAGARAAVCWTREIAELARKHNNANILCVPARFVTDDSALEMVDAFIQTAFEGGRHQRRVEKMSC